MKTAARVFVAGDAARFRPRGQRAYVNVVVVSTYTSRTGLWVVVRTPAGDEVSVRPSQLRSKP